MSNRLDLDQVRHFVTSKEIVKNLFFTILSGVKLSIICGSVQV